MTTTPATIGSNGIALCHHYEGCKLVAYPDPATGGDPWTIGWGDTGPDVVRGLQITQEEADNRFCDRINSEFAPGVDKAIKTVPNQNQFDAMIALAYNIGLGNFNSSTLVKKFNSGDQAGAAEEFPKWNKAGGKVMKGLQRRRWAERLVYLGRDAASAIKEAEAKYP